MRKCSHGYGTMRSRLLRLNNGHGPSRSTATGRMRHWRSIGGAYTRDWRRESMSVPSVFWISSTWMKVACLSEAERLEIHEHIRLMLDLTPLGFTCHLTDISRGTPLCLTVNCAGSVTGSDQLPTGRSSDSTI